MPQKAWRRKNALFFYIFLQFFFIEAGGRQETYVLEAVFVHLEACLFEMFTPQLFRADVLISHQHLFFQGVVIHGNHPFVAPLCEKHRTFDPAAAIFFDQNQFSVGFEHTAENRQGFIQRFDVVESVLQDNVVETVFLHVLIEEVGVLECAERGVAVLAPELAAAFPLFGVILQRGTKNGLPFHGEIEARGAVAAAAVPDFRVFVEGDLTVLKLQTLHKVGFAELLARRRAVGQLVVRIQPSVLAQFLTKMFVKDLPLHDLRAN